LSESLKRSSKKRGTKSLFCGRGLNCSSPLKEVPILKPCIDTFKAINRLVLKYLLSYFFSSITLTVPRKMNTLTATKTAFLTRVTMRVPTGAGKGISCWLLLLPGRTLTNTCYSPRVEHKKSTWFLVERELYSKVQCLSKVAYERKTIPRRTFPDLWPVRQWCQ